MMNYFNRQLIQPYPPLTFFTQFDFADIKHYFEILQHIVNSMI